MRLLIYPWEQSLLFLFIALAVSDIFGQTIGIDIPESVVGTRDHWCKTSSCMQNWIVETFLIPEVVHLIEIGKARLAQKSIWCHSLLSTAAEWSRLSNCLPLYAFDKQPFVSSTTDRRLLFRASSDSACCTWTLDNTLVITVEASPCGECIRRPYRNLTVLLPCYSFARKFVCDSTGSLHLESTLWIRKQTGSLEMEGRRWATKGASANCCTWCWNVPKSSLASEI